MVRLMPRAFQVCFTLLLYIISSCGVVQALHCHFGRGWIILALAHFSCHVSFISSVLSSKTDMFRLFGYVNISVDRNV